MKHFFLTVYITLQHLFPFLPLSKNQVIPLPSPSAAVDPLTLGYSVNPGKIANIFGWRYNRAVCPVANSSVEIVFFYAENQHIYYTFTDNTSQYYQVHLDNPLNPDFDILCQGEKIYLSFSDPNQQRLYLAQFQLGDRTLQRESEELVYEGHTNYTAIAPQTRILKGSPFISFMEYGRNNTDTPNSKVFVSMKDQGKWQTTEIFAHPATYTQVLGISLELYKDTLLAFITPYPGGMYISRYNATTKTWSKPLPQSGLQTRGHLEWQSITDSHGVLHLVFRNDKQTLSYAQLGDDGIWSIQALPESLAINSFSIFEVKDMGVYTLYSNGLIRKVIGNKLSMPLEIPDHTNKQSLYFLQLPAQVTLPLHPIWLKGVSDGVYNIQYDLTDFTGKETPFSQPYSGSIVREKLVTGE